MGASKGPACTTTTKQGRGGAMREAWSVNRLATEFGSDRRTWSRVLDRAALKPSAQGSRGPLFRLRDAVGAMVDSGFLGADAERSGQWGHDEGRESGARELAERVVDALTKRLEGPALRVVL